MRAFQVPAAANIGATTTNEETREETLTPPRPNPVALEIPVTVTGARAGDQPGERNLFSEETTTVVVFRDGAVIRLAAGVAVGQLLFVTNKKSTQEMVCQVVRKRNDKPTSCFVELDFTEAVDDFWGVTFPAEVPEARHPVAAEEVEAAETTEEQNKVASDEPTPEEVEKLSAEVEKLRAQVSALVKGQAGLGKAKEAAGAKTSSVAAKAISATKLKLASVNDQTPVGPAAAPAARQEPAPKTEAVAEKQEAPRAVVGMALPNLKSESGSPVSGRLDPVEELLPKPELDFSKVPIPTPHAIGKDGKPIYKPARQGGGRLRIALLGALLVTVAAGAWYENWLPMLPRQKSVTAKKVPMVANLAKTVPAKAVEAPKVGGDSVAGVKDATAQDGKGDVAEKVARSTDAAGTEVVAKAETANRAAPVPDSRQAKPKSRVEAGATRAKVAADATTTETPPGEKVAAVEAANETNNGALVAAKLIKAASPVYPPDAMREYITGDVKVEAVVEADGRVGTVKVLSGPKPLREAAVEALKNYEYEAATQGGRAVASKVTVVVKFWFNP